MKRGRGDDQIGLRKRMTDLAAVFDEKPPLEHDILAHREDALFEHRAHFVREPIIQFRAAAGSATSSIPNLISASVTALT